MNKNPSVRLRVDCATLMRQVRMCTRKEQTLWLRGVEWKQVKRSLLIHDGPSRGVLLWGSLLTNNFKLKVIQTN